MAHDPDVLDYIESLGRKHWQGRVFRYAMNGRHPDDPNTYGARWNKRNLGAIYTSLEKDTVLTEFANLLANYTPRPSKITYTLYTLRVAIDDVIDLSGAGRLGSLGITAEFLGSPDFSHCQAVASAAHFLGAGGMLVPSARHEGTNLVIFPDKPIVDFEILGAEPLRA